VFCAEFPGTVKDMKLMAGQVPRVQQLSVLAHARALFAAAFQALVDHSICLLGTLQVSDRTTATL
jgi:hypothetical protein